MMLASDILAAAVKAFEQDDTKTNGFDHHLFNSFADHTSALPSHKKDELWSILCSSYVKPEACRIHYRNQHGPGHVGPWLHQRTVGNCLNEYRCQLCGETFTIDSSD